MLYSGFKNWSKAELLQKHHLLFTEDYARWERWWKEILVAEAKSAGLRGAALERAKKLARDAFLLGANYGRSSLWRHSRN